MTTELEEQFFKVFGIEERCICSYSPDYMENGCELCIKYFQDKKNCNGKNRYKYPEITAEKLLQMICIYNSTYTNGFTNYSLLNEKSTEELKGHILRNCLKVRDDVYNQIQQLFKEEE